jgi:hypothetical protein
MIRRLAKAISQEKPAQIQAKSTAKSPNLLITQKIGYFIPTQASYPWQAKSAYSAPP